MKQHLNLKSSSSPTPPLLSSENSEPTLKLSPQPYESDGEESSSSSSGSATTTITKPNTTNNLNTPSPATSQLSHQSSNNGEIGTPNVTNNHLNDWYNCQSSVSIPNSMTHHSPSSLSHHIKSEYSAFNNHLMPFHPPPGATTCF